MGGTRTGGLKVAAAVKKKFGKDYYKKIGQRGGQNGNTGGFAANPELAREVGKIGGSRSSRKGIPSTTYKGKKKHES